MIAFLRGSVFAIFEKSLIVLTQSGVGYDIDVASKLASSLSMGDEISLYVFEIIRQDSIDLYGFIDKNEKVAFELLITSPQVGPKMAMTILDFYSLSDLARIVLLKDIALLKKIKGLGEKTSQRLSLDIASWVDKGIWPIVLDKNDDGVICSNIEKEAYQALMQLGYKEIQIKKIIRKALDDTVEATIKNCLKLLVKSG